MCFILWRTGGGLAFHLGSSFNNLNRANITWTSKGDGFRFKRWKTYHDTSWRWRSQEMGHEDARDRMPKPNQRNRGKFFYLPRDLVTKCTKFSSEHQFRPQWSLCWGHPPMGLATHNFSWPRLWTWASWRSAVRRKGCLDSLEGLRRINLNVATADSI